MVREAVRAGHPEVTYEYLILNVFPDDFTAADKLLARRHLDRHLERVREAA
jgi:hypothetical protein